MHDIGFDRILIDKTIPPAMSYHASSDVLTTFPASETPINMIGETLSHSHSLGCQRSYPPIIMEAENDLIVNILQIVKEACLERIRVSTSDTNYRR